MAVIDTNKTKKPLIVDRDEDISIGFNLPLEFDNGYNTLTKTTLEAVKVDMRNLLQTELGERLMQPNLGVKIRHYLFEPYTIDIVNSIKNSILDTFTFWLPFIEIKKIDINEITTNADIDNNRINIFVEFSLKKEPTVLEF